MDKKVAENGNFYFDNVVACKMKENDLHILRNAKVLPCGNTACAECITDALDDSFQFQCPFEGCNRIHYVPNVEDLPANVTAETALKDNRRRLIEYLIDKLQKSLDKLKGAFNESNIYSIFEYNEAKIIARIDLLRAELDKLQDDALKILRSYRHEFVQNFRESYELRESNCNKFVAQLKEQVHNLNTKDDTLKKNMYMCQDYIAELKEYSNEKLKEILFKPSNWVPNIDIIGDIKGCNISKILTNKLRILNLKVNSANGMCFLGDGNLLVTSFEENKVFLVNNTFKLDTQITKEVSTIRHYSFNGPFGICNDASNSIYICDSLHDRVLVTDTDFMKVKKVIGKSGTGSGEFDSPCDICFYEGSIYILDTGNKRVQEFNSLGEFVREMKLYKRGIEQADHSYKKDVLDNPVRLAIIENVIAVNDNFTDVYTYNFSGKVMQVFKNARDMCFIDNYLMTCNSDGVLTCYSRGVPEFGKYYYTLVYRRFIEVLKTPLSFMKYFDGHLLFTLNAKKQNMAIL